MGSGPAQKSIGDTVYERLKESILCHEFPGGTRLREGTLAENYDVSRTPVRNAIERLEKEGLVVRNDDKLFVLQLSEADISNLFTLRCELAIHAMIQAANKIRDEELLRLSELASEADNKLITGSVQDQCRADMAFHDYLLDCAHNPFFTKLRCQMNDRLIMAINSIFAEYDFRNKNKEELPSSHRLLVNNLIEYRSTGLVRPLELVIEHHFSFHPGLSRVSHNDRTQLPSIKTVMSDFPLTLHKSGDRESSAALFNKIQENNPFYPLNRSVYDLLLHDIIVGRIMPDDELNISELAAQLNISRNPVRDAVDRLEDEGLLQRGRRKEVFLHRYTEIEIENIYFARLALETSAAALAARFASPQELASIQRAHLDFVSAVKAEDTELCIVFDSTFHTEIVNGSHNYFVIEAYKALYPHIRAWVWQATRVIKHSTSIWKNIVKDHERILDYLNRHNPDGAKLSMKQHMVSIVNEEG